MKKLIVGAVAIAAIAVAVAGCYRWLWSVRQTPEQTRETEKAVRREFRKAPLDEAAPRLRKMFDEHFFTVKFGKKFTLLPSVGFAPRVSYDFIGLLTEEAFIRLAGDMKSPKADTDRRIKELLDFSATLISADKLTSSARDSLRERRLDGYFLIDDFDGAIAELNKGMPGHTPEWCTSTVAKLRAHKAMNAKQNKEAIKQLKIFIDYMLSDAMKDFEDSDPANGVIYSREWVVAKNYMRCANLSGADGDEKAKAEYIEKAKPFYKQAAEKAKDDEVSMKELAEEMKSFGL